MIAATSIDKVHVGEGEGHVEETCQTYQIYDTRTTNNSAQVFFKWAHNFTLIDCQQTKVQKVIQRKLFKKTKERKMYCSQMR